MKKFLLALSFSTVVTVAVAEAQVPTPPVPPVQVQLQYLSAQVKIMQANLGACVSDKIKEQVQSSILTEQLVVAQAELAVLKKEIADAATKVAPAAPAAPAVKK